MDLTRNQAHQRGFTAARTTHYGGEIALWNAEVDVVQNRTVAICEGNVFHSMKGVELMQERGVEKCILITGIVKGIGYSGNFQTACA